jgi:GT2 family glycosyltransferase
MSRALVPSATARPGQVVPGNRWDELEVPALGSWRPTARVSVIVPHYEAPDALAITLAGLARQTYPAALTEVVVVDDGSATPPRVATGHRGLDVTVLHQEDRGFGLARARNTGARAADGEVLVFLDGDMVPEPGHLEAHARWHHVCDHAVTLGFRQHVTFEGIAADDVDAAASAGALAPLFVGREPSRPLWLERHMVRMADLTGDDDDLFRAVTGGNLGVRAQRFWTVGGFDESFTQWGSEDTDLGHRLFLAGAVLVPDGTAACWHQSDSRGLEPHERASLEQQRARLSQTVPHPGFRRLTPGRTFAVPRVVVTVDVGRADHAAVTGTLESLLASDLPDLEVVLSVPTDHPDRVRLRREWSGDGRVVDARRPAHRRTPYSLRVPAGAAVVRHTLDGLLAQMTDRSAPLGVLRVALGDRAPTDADTALLTATRAIGRAELLGADDVLATAGELFGTGWIDGAEVGLTWAPVTELARIRPRPPTTRPAVQAIRPETHRADAGRHDTSRAEVGRPETRRPEVSRAETSRAETRRVAPAVRQRIVRALPTPLRRGLRRVRDRSRRTTAGGGR